MPIDVLRARRAGARDQHRVALVVEGAACAGAWMGLRSIERVLGERVDRDVLHAHAWR